MAPCLRQLTRFVLLATCPAVQNAAAVGRGLLLRLRRRRGAGLLEEVRRQVRGRTHVHLRRFDVTEWRSALVAGGPTTQVAWPLNCNDAWVCTQHLKS